MTSLGNLSRERWLELEPLLDVALELEPARRAAYLDAACDGDLALCAEVRSLVDACDLGAGILETSAAITYAPLLCEDVAPMPALLGGRYRIVREIGRGGMATVYLADDPKHGRQVAVKTLRGELARRSGRVRFVREIEIAAGLSHPHILPLHDSGEESTDGESPPLLYFVSPFAGGETLRDRLRREPRLAPNEVVRLGGEIALALDYAHRRGVIHLDIKPENILLQEGHAVVADFGIARAISSAGDEFSEAAGTVLGTPSYMSPEQASGAPNVDRRSDIYSLGCVLYELITGALPFQVAPSPNDDVPDASALMEYVAPELASVVLRSVAPLAEDRFATAGELAAALTTAGRARRNRSSRSRIIVVAAITVAAGYFGYWFTHRHSDLDPNLVAVAPFDVEMPTLALWKEGLVDVMSRSLDRQRPPSISNSPRRAYCW